MSTLTLDEPETITPLSELEHRILAEPKPPYYITRAELMAQAEHLLKRYPCDESWTAVIRGRAEFAPAMLVGAWQDAALQCGCLVGVNPSEGEPPFRLGQSFDIWLRGRIGNTTTRHFRVEVVD